MHQKYLSISYFFYTEASWKYLPVPTNIMFNRRLWGNGTKEVFERTSCWMRVSIGSMCFLWNHSKRQRWKGKVESFNEFYRYTIFLSKNHWIVPMLFLYYLRENDSYFAISLFIQIVIILCITIKSSCNQGNIQYHFVWNLKRKKITKNNFFQPQNCS